MEQPHPGMQEGRDSFSYLFPPTFHNFDFSNLSPLNNYQTNHSTTSLTHSSQLFLSPFDAWSFSESGKITWETLPEPCLRPALEEPWNPPMQVTMEQLLPGMQERMGNEFRAYEGSGDSLSSLCPHAFHNLELNTYQTNQSTISLTHLSQPYLDPFDAWIFSESGKLARETLPELSLGFALEDPWNALTQVRSSQSPWQFGDDSRTFMSREQAMQQQASQRGFQVSLPPSQDTSEWGSISSNTKYTPGPGESVLSPATAPSTPSPISHPKSPSCLPFPQRRRQTTRNLLHTQNSHTNRSKEGYDKPEKCPLCPQTAGAARDINRHLWSQHRQFAVRSGIKSETRDCPFRRCGYRGRRDNVNRHYKAKHGGCIKWNRGGVLVS